VGKLGFPDRHRSRFEIPEKVRKITELVSQPSSVMSTASIKTEYLIVPSKNGLCDLDVTSAREIIPARLHLQGRKKPQAIGALR
jgi:hypothetical protein